LIVVDDDDEVRDVEFNRSLLSSSTSIILLLIIHHQHHHTSSSYITHRFMFQQVFQPDRKKLREESLWGAIDPTAVRVLPSREGALS
jgi:hypothetical protein